MTIYGGGSSQREGMEMGRELGAESTGLDARVQKARGEKGAQEKR